VIDQSAFRDALGTFVTGVTIVTAYDAAGKPSGLTANSFNSVSLDPPMVLWSLSLGSRNLPVFREAKAWAVHILAADQQDLSNRFARAGEDKFGDLNHGEGPEGAPRLAEHRQVATAERQAPEHHRRIERNRIEAVRGQPGGLSGRIICGDNGHAGHESAERVAKGGLIDHGAKD